MKRQKLANFLEGKMDFISFENTRHTAFSPNVNGNKIALPKVVTLTRSSKEVPLNNIKGVAASLHYTVRELTTGLNCSLSGATGNISLCVNMFHFIREKVSSHPNETDCFVGPMRESIGMILEKSLLMWNEGKKTKQDEAKLLLLSKELAILDKECKGELASIVRDIANTIFSITQERSMKYH